VHERVEALLQQTRRSIDLHDLTEASESISKLEQLVETEFESAEITAEIQYFLARQAFLKKDIPASLTYLSESLKIYTDLGNPEKEALLLTYLSDYSLISGMEEDFKIYVYGALQKYIELGSELIKESNYPKAERSYKIARELAYKIEAPEIHHECMIKSLEGIVHSRLRYCTDLSIVSNYYSYSTNPMKSQREAWRAMMIALDTIRFIVDRYQLEHNDATEIVRDPTLDKFIHEFMDFFPMAQRCLRNNTDREILPVIDLKLNELKKLFLSLADEIPDKLNDVKIWIDTQKESLRFLIPLSVPSFMFLTPDGRLIHHYSQTYVENPSSTRNSSQHLLAGILMAIRTVFHETQILGSGGIREINAVGGTLIIESRPNVMVISICDIVFPEIKEKTRFLADHAQQQYSQILKKWNGTKQMLADFIADIDHQLSTFSL